MDIYLLLIIILLPLLANIIVNNTYKKYSDIRNEQGLSGKEVAKKILLANGLSNVDVLSTTGTLSDNYNHKLKKVFLSKDIFESNSIASVAVAAHEVGHALQDKERYFFMTFRTRIVPIVNFASRISTTFIILGLFTEIINLYYIGIFLLLFGLLFQLITLPVEFNASKRAKYELQRLNLVSEEDSVETSKMLKAAAFTYVAGFLAMAAQIIRLIGLRNRN